MESGEEEGRTYVRNERDVEEQSHLKTIRELCYEREETVKSAQSPVRITLSSLDSL